MYIINKLFVLVALQLLPYIAISQSITTVIITPNAPSCSSPVQITTNGYLSCANAVQMNNSFVIVGNTITVSIYEVIGQICLPAIVPYTDVQNIGILNGGSYSVTVNYYINNTLVSTFPTAFTVTGGGGVVITPPVVICPGDSAMIHGQWQSDIGVYADTFTGGPCDSISVTFLDWYSDPGTVVDIDLCYGDSVFAGGAWQFSGGNFIDTLTSVIGCDSVVNSKINLYFPSFGSSTEIICQGDSAYLGGSWQTSAGLYSDVFLNVQGCDSTHITSLNVISGGSSSVNDTICNGDSIFLGGDWQNSTGVYYDTISGGLGSCDSVVETTLSVLTVSPVSIDTFPCKGDSVWFEGNYWLEDTVLLTSTTISGCETDYTIAISFIDCSTGITSIKGQQSFVFPNPADERVYFYFENQQPREVQLFDTHGKYIKNLDSGSDVSDLPSGIYWLKYHFKHHAVHARLMINR